ncbi:MAG: ABC transporter permease, partial [Candidatus Latescibacteria bacterium]|nr:ABC transporter permease [Candidatus Latescibacterota bacterium]
SDEAEAYILNEAIVRELGWDAASAIGKEFRVGGRGKGRVIGVVRDFHFQSLHQKIEPLVLRIEPEWFSMVAIKISPGDISGTLDFMKQKWEMVSPAYPFIYHFLDTDFDRLYKADERLSRILGYFTLLAIVIACLGLFGLTSFATEQRTKEIGIRKILGASISGIVLLLSKEFTKLVIVSNLIAWPVAYWAMNRWLQDFAYRIHIGVGTFLLAGVLALVIALLTVSFQAIKAALANPVEALRYE